MASQLQLSRETRVYLTDGTVYWRLPVLDGFSFSQATESTEVTVNEMESTAGISRRGRAMFNDALAPAEWSFSTYARPFNDSSNGGVSIEEPLWGNFIANNTYTNGTRSWAQGVTRATSDNSVTYDFDDSNKSTLGTFDLYFVMGGCAASSVSYAAANGQAIYKIEGCVVNSATMNFEIDGISMIEWSGFGNTISEEATLDLSAATVIEDGISDTDNFIRNRLTTLAVSVDSANQGSNFESDYILTLTGGSITFENNITYLTPEELCKVNQPIGHVTGTRNISGNFTCYLNTGSDSGGGVSADLFEDLAGATTIQTNHFDLTFSIGGSSSPKVVINVPNAHLEIPAHQIEDVIALDTAFHALPTGLGDTDEATVAYYAP